MAARGRGLSRQGLDKKRLENKCQLRRGINTATASGDVFFAKFGEDDGDVDRAHLSANIIEREWGPGVSDSVGASARERERGGPGWASWAGSVAGLKSWRWPFSISFLFFFFYFDFLD